ncbi:hypothetical protein ONA24_02150 [Mycoplasmopsis cynos]|uniref:hypothetical protein n=1 Tax=Mycoplasmopsis cynos TaxID=171284 RepID=UPI0024CBECA3|nr:hypothetical protein [Mycoplasmopsis cynos]WAM10084.1 hypothetical protein ONA24_02150 [Mycoplasmopsis cynos]
MVKSKNGIRIGLKCPKKFPCLKPYQNNAVGEVISVEVTDKLRKVLKLIKLKRLVVEQDFLMTLDYIQLIKEPELDPNTKEGLVS